LVALNDSYDAESLLNHALLEARRLGRRDHESQLYIVLGRMAEARGDKDAAIKYLKYLKSASDLARNAQFYRMDAESMFELASLYRTENQLDLAEESLQQGITAGRKIGDRFFLPRDLAALAEIKDRRGEPEAAEALYEQATDVLDGLLVNSASPDAKSSIVAAMSDIYIRHFALAVRLRRTSKAFAIVERARGRTAADLLRASVYRPIEAPNGTSADRAITNLQLRLLHSVSVAERKEILADLFDAEQKRFLEAGTQSSRSAAHPIDISDLRRVLHPDELLLEYVVSDAGSYCLAVSQSHSALIRLTKGRAALERAVRSYLSAVHRSMVRTVSFGSFSARAASPSHSRKMRAAWLFFWTVG